MNIIAIDDEPLALDDLVRSLQTVRPSCAPLAFSNARDALRHVEQEPVDVAFLDIEMPGMNGLTLAKRFKELQPDMHIVFVTSYEQYALDAFALHATGYLLKPVKEDELKRELTFVYDHGPKGDRPRVRIQTFDGFEVYVDETPLSFKRSKTKELLALLVDRRGTSVTTREACAILWEDAPYGVSQRSYFQSIVADLRSALAAVHADDIIIKTWGNLALDIRAVDCDIYRFLDGDPVAVNAYRGSYLPAYSWAEFSTASIHFGT